MKAVLLTLNALSLDAPIVAVVWQAGLAALTRTPLLPPEQTALFLVVWAVYLLDRWLDVSDAPTGHFQTTRHRAASRHRLLYPAAATTLSLAAASLALVGLPRSTLMTGTVVALLTFSYLLCFHWHRTRRGVGPVKELAIGMIFALGCAIPSLARSAHPGMALMATTGFAVLCCMNLILIAHWERDAGEGASHPTLLDQCPGLPSRLPWLPVAACGGLLVATAIVPASGAFQALLAVAILPGMIGLLVLDRGLPRLGLPVARVLADLALIPGPLVVLAVSHQ